MRPNPTPAARASLRRGLGFIDCWARPLSRDSDIPLLLLGMRPFRLGNNVPSDLPGPVGLMLEFSNEIYLVRHRHISTAVLLIISAAIHGQVSATRDIYRFVDEADFPIGLPGESKFKARLVGLNSDCGRTATFHRDNIRGIVS